MLCQDNAGTKLKIGVSEMGLWASFLSIILNFDLILLCSLFNGLFLKSAMG